MPAVAVLIFLGELGVPTLIPIEMALLLVGSHAVHSPVGLLVALALVTTADLLGTTVLHLVARTSGSRLLRRFQRRHGVKGDGSMDRWRQRLGRHDAVAVFVLRLLPLVRMWAAVGTGLLRLPVRDFLLGAAPAALLWAGTPLVLGYFFRGDVQRFEARYTAVAHALLLGLPLVGLLSGLVWWVRGGHSLAARVRRGRVAGGLVAAMASLAYAINVISTTDEVMDRGQVALPPPVLAVSLALLGGLTVALLWWSITDLRLVRARVEPRDSMAGFISAEAAPTVVWLSLVSLIGVVVAGLELRYPVL